MFTGRPDYDGDARMTEHDQAALNRSPIVLEVFSSTWQKRVRPMDGQPGTVLLGYIRRTDDVGGIAVS